MIHFFLTLLTISSQCAEIDNVTSEDANILGLAVFKNKQTTFSLSFFAVLHEDAIAGLK